jgi:Leucine-rich repeat (LRR) protein
MRKPLRRIREAEKTGAIELNLSGRKDGKDTGLETLNRLPPELEGLTSLQSLDLNRCLGIRRFAPLESLLPRLKELVLSGCQFDDLPHEVCGERYENVLVKVRAHYGLQPPQVFVSYAWGDTSPTASEVPKFASGFSFHQLLCFSPFFGGQRNPAHVLLLKEISSFFWMSALAESYRIKVKMIQP